MRAVGLRAFRRQPGVEHGPPHGGGSRAVTELLVLHVAPSVQCIAAGGRGAGAGSQPVRDPPPAWRFAQLTISWLVRGGHRVTRRPRSAERGPHWSGGHEADAGSEAARGPPPATGRRCARPTVGGGSATVTV